MMSRNFVLPARAGALLRPPLLLIGLLASASATLATTWAVEADPSSPEGRVEAVVRQAASGDSILIGPGLYYEHIEIPSITLTFIGREGAASTILDGSRTFPGHYGSIIYVRHPIQGVGELRVRGLTLQGGWGKYGNGGGVYWGGPGSRFDAQDCVFANNGRSPDTHRGAAIYVSSMASARIHQCSFMYNKATEQGGAIYANACDQLEVTSSTFEDDGGPGGWRFVMHFRGHNSTGSARIEDCVFRVPSERYMAGGSCFFDAVNVELIRNRFEDYVGGLRGATYIGIGHSWTTDPPGAIRIIDNTFWLAPGQPGADDVALDFFNDPSHAASLEITDNTFVRCPLSIGTWGSSVLERNLLYDSHLQYYSSGGNIACNDFWLDGIDIHPQSHPTQSDNLDADPLLCDDPGADLHIADVSPCAPDHAPPGCGLIGALGVACSATPVIETTWGRIKATFR